MISSTPATNELEKLATELQTLLSLVAEVKEELTNNRKNAEELQKVQSLSELTY